MTPESPIDPRQALEASLTALLLGELPPDQAAFLRHVMAGDPELAKMHQRLKQTIELVRETETTPAAAAAPDAAALKLSDERRTALLQHFKTITPREFKPPRERRTSWLVPLAVAAMLMVLLSSMMLPSLSRAKFKSQALSNRASARFALTESLAQRETAATHSANLSDERALAFMAEPAAKKLDTVSSGVAETPVVAAADSPSVAFAVPVQKGIVLPAGGKPAIQSIVTVVAPTPLFAAPPPNVNAGQPAFGGYALSDLKPDGGKQPMLGVEFDKISPGRASLPALQSPAAGAYMAMGEPQPVGVLDVGKYLPNAGLIASAGGSGGGGMGGGSLGVGMRGGGGGVALPLSAPPALTLERPPAANTAGRALSEPGTAPSAETLARRYGIRPATAGEVATVDPATDLPATILQRVDPTTGLPLGAARQTAGDVTLGLVPDSKNRDQGALGDQLRKSGTSTNTYNYQLNVVGYVDQPALATNGFVLADAGLRGFYDDDADGFSTSAPSKEAAVNEAVKRTGYQASTQQQSAPIEAKKSELKQLAEAQRSLEARLLAEGNDAMVPKSSTVEIVDKASPPPPPSPGLLAGLGRVFRGEPEARARVRIYRDQSDVSGLRGQQTAGAYDPYFIQSEFETIQSEVVLGDVVKKLNLNKVWANKGGTVGELKTEEALRLLKQKLDLHPVRNTGLVEIGVKDSKPAEAANIANAVAEAYQRHRRAQRVELAASGVESLTADSDKQAKRIREVTAELARLENQPANQQADAPQAKPATPLPVPQPEVQTRDNAYSTFSLNVSDVSFKLAAASLEKGALPDPASIRSEEFINAFDYRDPEAQAGAPVAFAWERARYPFAQNRDLLRFSLKTAAQGRQAGRPLNLVLLLDNSGSMERADRVRIINEALHVLASQLQPQDTLSVITFARTARLWVDGVPGSQAGQVADEVGKLTPQGGTNLGEAMDLAYQTALRHYLANGINRVVLLTDGAANLGDVEPASLKAKVEANRKQGIALDCFGIGWEGYNDDLLEVLTRNGDGRYGFINTPEEAVTEFAGQLAGALRVAASDVKVQVEFNPGRVTAYRQIGYAKHQLTKEQFRDNTVNAAQIGAAESGNALYVIETNPAGEGPLGTVRVRYRVPGTTDYQEREWVVPYTGNAPALEQSSPAMRLAGSAGAFSEWLATSPYAAEVTPDAVLGCLRGVPAIYGADIRPGKLEWMVRQAKSIGGR